MPSPQSPRFQLESLPYQTAAVDAVVRVFEGTPPPGDAAAQGNRCPLSWEALKVNLEAVAQSHRISQERLNPSPPAPGQPLDLCVEKSTYQHVKQADVNAAEWV